VARRPGSHYGIVTVSPEKLRVTMRDVDVLVALADQAVNR
jgi:hypothetical protein